MKSRPWLRSDNSEPQVSPLSTPNCPACLKQPKKWHGHATYDLHPELQGSFNYYVACEKHPEISGQGKTAFIAIDNFMRAVNRWKREQFAPRTETWLGLDCENKPLE